MDDPVIALLSKVQENSVEAERITTGSSEWDNIIAATIQFWVALATHPELAETLGEVFKSLLVAIYLSGYRRGKREAILPKFVVLEDK